MKNHLIEREEVMYLLKESLELNEELTVLIKSLTNELRKAEQASRKLKGLTWKIKNKL